MSQESLHYIQYLSGIISEQRFYEIEEELNESLARNLMGAGALAIGSLFGGEASAQSGRDQIDAIKNKISDHEATENAIELLKDGKLDFLLMKTNLTDKEKSLINEIEYIVKRNPHVALDILKEKQKQFLLHSTQRDIDQGGLDLNDPVVKFIFKLLPQFKKAMEKGGKNWVELEGPSTLYDLKKEKDIKWKQEDLSKLLRKSIEGNLPNR